MRSDAASTFRPNFRNLILQPLWMSLKTAMRTFPIVGRMKSGVVVGNSWSNDYHAVEESMLTDEEAARLADSDHPAHGQTFTADRETSELVRYINRPVTVLYPYERLEDLEPWLFVPGNYNGRIGIIWETCTACKACVRICPNSCLHMTSELRVDVLDGVEEGEHADLGGDLEVGGYAARRKEDWESMNQDFSISTAHEAPDQVWDYASIVDLSGDVARVRWEDGGAEEEVPVTDLTRAEQEIVSGMIDIGRCMFCGLCMEACNFTSFFMTNEYDGMSSTTREGLWFDADRTRVLPEAHQEAVDGELAERAAKERRKRERAAEKAAKAKAAEA